MKKSIIMVCITAQLACEKIITEARKCVTGPDTELNVISILHINDEAEHRNSDLECLKKISVDTGEEVTVIYSDTPALSIVEFAEKNEPVHIFTGMQGKFSDFVNQLSIMCNAPISMVSSDGVTTVPPVLNLNK